MEPVNCSHVFHTKQMLIGHWEDSLNSSGILAYSGMENVISKDFSF